MINSVLKSTRKWIPELKADASYLKMFNQALDNFELNKLDERARNLSLVINGNSKSYINSRVPKQRA